MTQPANAQPGLFKIDKKVPMPKPRSGRGGKYPFAQMAVGDSFALNGINPQVLAQSARYYSRHSNRRFSVRKLTDGSYRCWRVA
jgi:hypothetical protein